MLHALRMLVIFRYAAAAACAGRQQLVHSFFIGTRVPLTSLASLHVYMHMVAAAAKQA